MTRSAIKNTIATLICTVVGVTAAEAQTTGAPPARSIGRQGATQVSFGASMFGTVSETTTPTRDSRGVITGFTTGREFQGVYFGNWDIGYFTTEHVVVKIGNTFNGQVNAEDAKPSVVVTGLSP